jgi:STE24 endopeptidase
LDRIVGTLGFSEIPTGVIYLGTLFLLNELFSLPFSIYATFVLEERFGFNKTTPEDLRPGSSQRSSADGRDRRSAVGPFVVVFWAVGFLCVALGLGRGDGRLLSCFSLLRPRWILPLFNKFTPLPRVNYVGPSSPMLNAWAIPSRTFLSWTGRNVPPRATRFLRGLEKTSGLPCSTPWLKNIRWTNWWGFWPTKSATTKRGMSGKGLF